MPIDVFRQAHLADDIEAAAHRDRFAAAPAEFVAGVGLRAKRNLRGDCDRLRDAATLCGVVANFLGAPAVDDGCGIR